MISASAEKTVLGSAAAGAAAKPLFPSSATSSIISGRFRAGYRIDVSAGLRVQIVVHRFPAGIKICFDGRKDHVRQDPVRKKAVSPNIG
jgi:hypothetical protein